MAIFRIGVQSRLILDQEFEIEADSEEDALEIAEGYHAEFIESIPASVTDQFDYDDSSIDVID